MNERRAAPRKRTLKTGKIITSAKAPKLDCTVRNLSIDGAKLKLSTTLGIPARFDLMIGNDRHTCRVVWIEETEVGVMFV